MVGRQTRSGASALIIRTDLRPFSVAAVLNGCGSRRRW